MAWITPKTDWKAEYDGTGAFVGDYVNIQDYNRIKNNLLILWDMACAYYGPIPVIHVGNDKTYSDYYYADEWNLIEDGLQVILDAVEWEMGAKQTFVDNGHFITYSELNRIETAELRLYEFLPKAEGYFVHYQYDTNIVAVKDIPIGDDCISNAPEVSVPGYTMHGWREDTTASSTVLSSKTCDQEGITLYAVLKKAVVASYNGNGNTGGSTASTTGYKYYNNGNSLNPQITLANNGYTKTGYLFTKWAMGSTSGTQYSAGASVTLSADTTFYALWQISTITIATTPNNFPNWNWNISGGFGGQHQTDPNGNLYVSAHSGYDDECHCGLSFTVTNVSGHSKIYVYCRNSNTGSAGDMSVTVAGQTQSVRQDSWATLTFNIPSGASSVTVSMGTWDADYNWIGCECASVTLTT